MSLINLLQLLANVFMVMTVPIYVMYLITLYKNRKEETLKSPFFKLMFSVGIADVAMIITLMLGSNLASSGLVPEVFIFLGGLSARLAVIGLYGFGLAQDIGVLLVACNRFSAYILPIRHTQIWTDKVTRNVIIAQWTLSFIGITPLLFYFDFQITVEEDNSTVLFQWVNVEQSEIYSLVISGIICGLIVVSIVILYTIIFLSALKRKIVSKQPMSKTEKMALKMATAGFIASIGYFIILFDNYVLYGSWYLFQIDFPSTDVYYLIFNVGDCIYAAVNPYAMFFFSSIVRYRFADLFCRAWHPSYNDQSTAVLTTQVRTAMVQPPTYI